MTSAQKVIKYFAIAFAACLIVGIFSAAVFGGLGIFKAIGAVNTETKLELDCETISGPCLSIATGISELEIKTGETFKVEADSEKVNIKQNGDKLSITEISNSTFGWFENDKRKIIIYVPENLVFEKTNINSGTGKISVDSLTTKSLKSSLGIGEVSFTNLTVDNAKFDCGIGSVNVSLTGESSDYEIDVDKGIGDINFNGRSVKDHSTIGNGDHKIDIDGGIGAINITTK